MFDLIKARIGHGYQAVPNPITQSLPANFPGFPQIETGNHEHWVHLEKLCPTGAISNACIDLGKCIFCGECERAYPESVRFISFHHTAATDRNALIISAGMSTEEYKKRAMQAPVTIKKIFGKSFKLRSVSAGGCGACEMELNACGNVNFDMGRYGIDIVASPRHADAIVITGPISQNMAFALSKSWEATPEPKILILAGACAISGGIFASSKALDRTFLSQVRACLYIPGCPAHPLAIINGLAGLMGRTQ